MKKSAGIWPTIARHVIDCSGVNSAGGSGRVPGTNEVRQKAKELGLVEGIVDQAMAAKVRPAVLGPQTQARTISCIAPLYCRGCGLRTPVRQVLYRTGRCSHRWSLGPSGACTVNATSSIISPKI